jgi:O-antigen/teichoic acid export membrane protein
MLKELIGSSLIGLTAKIISGIGSFLIIPLLLRQLGVQNFGIWMSISSTVGLASFLDLGISYNLMNRLSYLNVNGSKAEIDKTITMAYLVQGVIVIILIFILSLSFFSLNWNKIYNVPSNFDKSVIYFSFFFFILNLVGNTIYSIQRGLQLNKLANYWLLFNSIFYVLSIFFLLSFSDNMRILAIATFGVPLLTSILNTFYFFHYKKINIDLSISLNYKSFSLFMGRGLVFLYLQITGLIAFQIDNLILAHIMDYKTVTEYNIALKLFTIPSIILGVYFQVLWPKYADFSAKLDILSLRKTFVRSIIFSALFVIPFVILIFTFSDELIRFWLKNQFSVSKELLVAFSIWTIINLVIATNLGVFYNGIDILKPQVITSFLMVICNLFLSIFLTRKIGVSGVVWGSIISSFFLSCLPLLIYLFTKIFNQKNLYRV